jgi:flagellar basal body-associated protein FliL
MRRASIKEESRKVETSQSKKKKYSAVSIFYIGLFCLAVIIFVVYEIAIFWLRNRA